MEHTAVRPYAPARSLPTSPKSIREVEADVISIISSLESLPPPPEPFPVDELLRSRQASTTTATPDDDAHSDTATVQYDYDDMTDVDVVGIQRACADALTLLLPPDSGLMLSSDQHLTTAISDLLEATYELETFHPSCSISSPHTPPDDAEPTTPFYYLLLTLSQVQSAAARRVPNPLALPDTPSTSCDMHPAVSAVREELAWARVESLSQAVIQLVRDRDLPPPPPPPPGGSLSLTSSNSLPPKYRRSERNSSEGSDSLKSLPALPPYNDYHNDEQVDVATSSSSTTATMLTEKPITGAGDLKARQEEEQALEEAQRRAASRAPLQLNKMGSILNDLDTVTHAIERLQSFSQMQDQRVALRPAAHRRLSKTPSLPSLQAPIGPEEFQRQAQRSNDRLHELDSIMERIERTHGDGQHDQRIDYAHRRPSRRQKLLVTTLEDTARTLTLDEHQPRSAEGNLARARDLRERGKFLNGLLGNNGSSTALDGVSDYESELGSPSRPNSLGQDYKVSPQAAQNVNGNASAGPSSIGQVLSEKKHANRRIYLYDDGPLTPQSRPISPRRRESENDGGFKPRSLSPASMEFMFKELPMPPDHEPRSRKTSRDTMGARRSLSPASDIDHDSTPNRPPRRARSPPRSVSMASRSSSLARMPLREGEVSLSSMPMSPTFSEISITSSRISASRGTGTPVRANYDEYFGHGAHGSHRLSTESKVSTWSRASSTGSRLSKSSSKPPSIKVSSKPPSIKVKSSKPPSLFSGTRSPSSRSLGSKQNQVGREEDLFDLLSLAAASSRMSNQEVELPRHRRFDAPKTDWEGLDNTEDTPPVTPRIVESVADGEWVIRLQDQENGLNTPRTPYSALNTSSSLGFPEVPRSARRNSFSSIISASAVSRAPPASPTVSSPGGSLKKFAASFKSSTMSRKNKSKPPPLRTSGVLDGSAVTYVTEYQENIRSIQVLISGVDITFLNTADLQLEVIAHSDAVLTSKSDSALRLNISLPAPAQQGQVVHLQPVDDYLEAKLVAVASASQGSGPLLHSTIAHALSAPNLRSLAPRSLCCTSCDRVVAHLPLDVEFKDLPSEYWAEMIEVWMCHADPTFTSQLAKHTSDGFWPSPDTVLVGGSYLLVSGSHICDSHLILEKSNEPDQWRIITCPCGEVLGKLRPEDGRPGAGTVRFSKWAIALLRGRGAGEISPVRFPVSTFVVSDMLELSQAHASHRFVICDERNGERRLAIWVFNPSIRVSYRRSNDGLTTAPPLSPLKGTFARHLYPNGINGRHTSPADVLPLNRTLRAAKIMFKVLDPLGSVAEYENLPGFGPRGQVEHLRYSRDVCATLIETLRASAALYPASRRNMGSFDVGFLERI